jgi:two-component sensor histidine kinase
LALNVPMDSKFGMAWLPLLPEDVRDAGTVALREASQGRSARFAGRSENAGEVMHWDNMLTPIMDDAGRVVSIMCVSRDVTEKVRLERQLEAVVAREKLLSREMQHRIKNLFSVAAALIFISEKEAKEDGSAQGATDILRDKLLALARASDVVFAEPVDAAGALCDTELSKLVASVLEPYGGRFSLSGGQVPVPHEMATGLALFLHEHATNSVKYGSMSADGGMVAIGWQMQDQMLQLEWAEAGGPEIRKAPARWGFGSEMVDRIVKAAGGRIERRWPAAGLVTQLHMPIAVRA